MRRITYALAIPAVALLALVIWQICWQPQRQTLPGRLVDYHAIYGLWDVACDTAMHGTDRGCYIQYVEVYRPRPEFAAAMVEVVMHPGADGQPDPHIRFDIEPELSFRHTYIHTVLPEGPRAVALTHCAGNTCRVTGDAARALLREWRRGRLP